MDNMFIAREYTAAEGGVILLIVLLIVTSAVFAVKFALDIAVNKRFNGETPDAPTTRKRAGDNMMYAVDSSVIAQPPQRSAPAKRRTSSAKSPQYTLIPDDKVFIVKRSE